MLCFQGCDVRDVCRHVQVHEPGADQESDLRAARGYLEFWHHPVGVRDGAVPVLGE